MTFEVKFYMNKLWRASRKVTPPSPSQHEKYSPAKMQIRIVVGLSSASRVCTQAFPGAEQLTFP